MNLEKAIEQLKKQVSPLGEPASIEAVSAILSTLKVQHIESELRKQKNPQFRVDVFDINTEHTKHYFDDISTALDFGKRVKQVVPSNVFILERSRGNLYDVIQEVSDITTMNNEEKEITIDVAKKAINDYYEKEFGKDSIVEDYSNLSKISLAYTNTEDEKHSIQSTADLSRFRINTFVDDKLVRQERFNNLRDMYNKALVNLNFNDLTYVSQDVIAELEQNEKNENNEIAFLFDDTKIGKRAQPFSDGYVIINASTKDEAVDKFKAQYGRGKHNEALCAEVVSDFNRVGQIKRSNLPCHNYIDLTKPQEPNQSNTEEQTDGRK